MTSKYLFLLSLFLSAIVAENFTEHSIGKRDTSVTYAIYNFGDTITISCSTSKTLTLHSFIYGLVTNNQFEQGNCHASQSQNIVENECEGKNSCNIVASNGVFGDPCPGTGKNLIVYATCTSGYISANAGENSNLYLKCPNNEIIDRIFWASYGNPVRSWADDVFVYGEYFATDKNLKASCILQNRILGYCAFDTSDLPDVAYGYTKNVLLSYTCQ